MFAHSSRSNKNCSVKSHLSVHRSHWKPTNDDKWVRLGMSFPHQLSCMTLVWGCDLSAVKTIGYMYVTPRPPSCAPWPWGWGGGMQQLIYIRPTLMVPLPEPYYTHTGNNGLVTKYRGSIWYLVFVVSPIWCLMYDIWCLLSANWNIKLHLQ